MIMLAKIMSVVIVAMGTSIFLNPKVFKYMINFWKKGKNIYIAGIIRLVFGTILLLVASVCRLAGVISVFGVLVIIGGVIIFVLKISKIHEMFNWWEKRDPMVLRLMGIVAIAIGALLLYSL